MKLMNGLHSLMHSLHCRLVCMDAKSIYTAQDTLYALWVHSLPRKASASLPPALSLQPLARAIEYNKNNVQFVKTDSSVVAVKLHLLYHTVCSDFWLDNLFVETKISLEFAVRTHTSNWSVVGARNFRFLNLFAFWRAVRKEPSLFGLQALEMRMNLESERTKERERESKT